MKVDASGHLIDHVPLGGDWLLWRDLAVRSAGFPVAGLDTFGPGDESARLQEVSRNPAFREAMTWQNPAAVANALVQERSVHLESWGVQALAGTHRRAAVRG